MWSLLSSCIPLCPKNPNSEICDIVVGLILKLISKVYSNGKGTGYAT